ncbi:MAG: DUF892 family protein [Solirubrobacterales bacterium]|nr:DUF892 family protein [Solirubrobacterales bacterium]MBV9535506.1 DUF892 family protein [Solirubrobacterales bacterium]
MSEKLEQQLVKELRNAHAIEKQAIQLLAKGAQMVDDEEIGRIFRAHRLPTEEHERQVLLRSRHTGRASRNSRT